MATGENWHCTCTRTVVGQYLKIYPATADQSQRTSGFRLWSLMTSSLLGTMMRWAMAN